MKKIIIIITAIILTILVLAIAFSNLPLTKSFDENRGEEENLKINEMTPPSHDEDMVEKVADKVIDTVIDKAVETVVEKAVDKVIDTVEKSMENDVVKPKIEKCDASYPTLCIPPFSPDLDCGEISARNFKVLQPDPHGFDRDRDGIGCEK